MSDIYDVVRVDPDDDDAFHAWFAVLHASQQERRPDEVDDLCHEQRQQARAGRDPDSAYATTLFAVRDSGGLSLGAARIDTPTRDNEHLAEIQFEVHPDARRRGVGRQLAEAVERHARELGRSTVLACADEPPGRQGRSAVLAGARALGMGVAQWEVRRDIDLPLDQGRVAGLTAGAQGPARDYRVLTWWDRCPDQLLEDRAALSHAMSVDVPKDEVDWREEAWDGARVRRHEARVADMDRTSVCGGAVHVSTGTLVAYTEMGVARSERRRAFQWDTVVLHAHRGHRLGMLVKLAALQELHACSPQTDYISTWNAQENSHMIAVNDALGARVNGRLATLQKVVHEPDRRGETSDRP